MSNNGVTICQIIHAAMELRPDTNIKVEVDAVDKDWVIKVYSVDIFDIGKSEILAQDRYIPCDENKSLSSVLSILTSK